MDVLPDAAFYFRAVVSVCFVLTGGIAAIKGLYLMTAAEYQQTLKHLAVQSAQIGQKAITDVAIGPVLEASAQLITAVNQLVRTSVGVGVFLTTGGTLLALLGYALFPFGH